MPWVESAHSSVNWFKFTTQTQSDSQQFTFSNSTRNPRYFPRARQWLQAGSDGFESQLVNEIICEKTNQSEETDSGVEEWPQIWHKVETLKTWQTIAVSQTSKSPQNVHKPSHCCCPQRKCHTCLEWTFVVLDRTEVVWVEVEGKLI